jgi:hypothetical protein
VLEALARVRSGLAALPEPPVPAGFEERLRAAVDGEAEPALPRAGASGTRGTTQTGDDPGSDGSTEPGSGALGPPGPRAGERAPRRRGNAVRVWAWRRRSRCCHRSGDRGGRGGARHANGGSPIAASGGAADNSTSLGDDGTGAAQAGAGARAETEEGGPAGAGADDDGATESEQADEASGEAGTASGTAGGGSAGPELPEGLLGDVPVLATGRDYSPAELPQAALRLADRAAASPPGTGAPVDPTPAAPAALGRLRDPEELTACLAALVGGPVRPLAVDLARFEGQAALVAVLEVDDGRPVASAGCSASDPERLLGPS